MSNNSNLRRRGARPGEAADESAGGIRTVPSEDSTSYASFRRDSSANVSDDDATNTTAATRMRRQMSGASVSKDESRLKKVATRIISSLIMISLFIAILLAGHVYVCALVFILQGLLFRELVTVRYNAYFDRIDQTIPLFRTTQWMWFAISIFYAYSEFAVEMIKSNTSLHYLLGYAQLVPMISFSLYIGTFVLTIATMQVGHIKFQLNQLQH